MFSQTNPYLFTLFFILGTIFGSFFNVCIYRIPRKLSIVSPRSYCPSCGHPIAWYDNIPIISYILLKASCRHCGTRIPIRYLIVELLSGTVFATCYSIFGITLHLLTTLTLSSLLIMIAFIDIETGLIPNPLVLSGICLGLLFNSLKGTPLLSIIGILTGGFTLYILTAMGKFIFKKEVMGGGDIKLLAMIGAYMGWYLTLLTLFTASLIGLLYAIVSRKHKITFGPFLAIASFTLIVLHHFNMVH